MKRDTEIQIEMELERKIDIQPLSDEERAEKTARVI